MTVFIYTLLLLLYAAWGMLLRYAPFASVVNGQRKNVLRLSYGLLTAVNAAVLLVGLSLGGVDAIYMYLRFGIPLYAALTTLVNILIIRGKYREHLFVFGVVVTCNLLLLAVPNYVITFLPGHSYLFWIMVIYGVLLLVSFFPLRKLLCRTVEPFLHLNADGYWNTVWFIPIALFGTRFLFAGGEHNSGGIMQLLSSGLSGTVIILICLSISKDHVQIQKRQQLEKQLVDQKLYYNQLQTRIEDTRKTKHDLKHHMAAILHFVEFNDKEGARDYCDTFMDRIQSSERLPYTGNSAVDSVLYYYIQQAQEKQIDLQCLGTIRSRGVADMDLCVLLGNALDNAITGCMSLPEGRSIEIISQSAEKLLSLMIRNTFDGKVKHGKEGLMSRKRSNAYGFGIRSMESVCQRYGGSLQTTWDDHTFTVMILLPLTPPDEA